MTKTYKETKALAKAIVLEKGSNHIMNSDCVKLYEMGCNVTDVQNAFNHFRFCKNAEKYIK